MWNYCVTLFLCDITLVWLTTNTNGSCQNTHFRAGKGDYVHPPNLTFWNTICSLSKGQVPDQVMCMPSLKATWHQICCSVSNVDLWQFRCVTDWGCNRSLSLVTGDQRDVQDGSLHVADPRLLAEVKHDLNLEWKKTQQGGLTFHLPCM